MAQRAIGHLKDAASTSPDDESWVPLSQLADRIIGMAKTLSAPFELRIQPPSNDAIPVQAAEAVYSAAVQAMVNSLQHAGSDASILRWVAIRGTGFGGIRVQIGDTGSGFLLGDVPVERLGLRVSILERVASAGGRVEIDSNPGEGTVIDIELPAPLSQLAATEESATEAGGAQSHPVRAASAGSAVSS